MIDAGILGEEDRVELLEGWLVAKMVHNPTHDATIAVVHMALQKRVSQSWHIRVQSAMIRPWNPVLKINPFEKWRIADYGDLSINPLSIEDTYSRITEQLGDVLMT